MHLTRDEISDLFHRELGSAPTDNPEELTMIARRALRKKYIAADVGITGANFAIAETGMVAITENEGNARLTAALPRVMISLLGIEKLLPRLPDRLSDLPQRRGAHLWDDLLRPDWFGHHAASARLAGLETSFLGFLALRGLHRDLPGKNQPASPPLAQPPQCRSTTAGVF